MPKLIIGGDICPTESNYKFFEEADVLFLVGEKLLELIHTSDYCFLNLEVALTNNGKPIKKTGPNLRAPLSCINGLKAINPYLFGLANNHIFDYGKEGLESTLEVLKQKGISFTGVGRNLQEADKGYIVDLGGTEIGFYCCAEHEFTIATDTMSGANPFDPLYSLDTIAALKQQCDYLVVLYHGGKEYYRYPSPRLQKVCRRIAEKGGDLVVCQHSHCVGCMENWENSVIVYGQGNFLFDGGDDEFWNTSLLIEVQFQEGEAKVNYIPLRKYGIGVRMDCEGGNVTMNGFRMRSEEILDPGFVSREYSKFAEVSGNFSIYSLLSRDNCLERVLNRISRGKRGRKYRWNDNLALLNYMECEAWNELCVTAMKKRL